MSRHLGWRLLAVIVLLGAAGALVLARPARLGLDLRGGTQIVLEERDSERQKVDGYTVDRTPEVLRRRVDQLGVTEPTLQRSGEHRPVLGVAQAGEQPSRERQRQGELILADEQGGRLRVGQAALGGGAVGDARAELDPQTQTRWHVAIDFRGVGGRQWADLTGKAACQPPGDPKRRAGGRRRAPGAPGPAGHRLCTGTGHPRPADHPRRGPPGDDPAPPRPPIGGPRGHPARHHSRPATIQRRQPRDRPTDGDPPPPRRAERLPFAIMAFDLVLVTMALRHWSNRAAGIAEIERILSAGGVLVVADVFPTCPRASPPVAWLRRWSSDRAGLPSELVALLGAHGLVPLARDRVPWTLLPNIQIIAVNKVPTSASTPGPNQHRSIAPGRPTLLRGRPDRHR